MREKKKNRKKSVKRNFFQVNCLFFTEVVSSTALSFYDFSAKKRRTENYKAQEKSREKCKR